MKSFAEKSKKKLQWVELLAPLITAYAHSANFPDLFDN
jgi:hypothetical protein